MGRSSPPCVTCPKPLDGLWLENIEAWEIFALMLSQPQVAGLGTVIGVNLCTFPVICDARNVPQAERSKLLDKIAELNSIFARYCAERADTDD